MAQIATPTGGDPAGRKPTRPLFTRQVVSLSPEYFGNGGKFTGRVNADRAGFRGDGSPLGVSL